MEHAKAGKGLTGATRVLQGAPGADRTAILSRPERLWEERGKTAPATVRVDVEDLEDMAGIVTRMAEAICPGVSGEWRTTRYRNFSGGAGTGGTRVGGQRGCSTTPERIDFHAMKEILPPQMWQRPVVPGMINALAPRSERTGPKPGR